MGTKRGILARRRVREAAPIGPSSPLPGPSAPAPVARPAGALAQRLQAAAPRAPATPTMPAPQPAPAVPEPTAPAASGFPQTMKAHSSASQAVYQGTKAQLEGRGVQVSDNFAPHHSLGARAQTFQAAHEALGHVGAVLPAMGRLAAHHGLQLHFTSAPQQVAASYVRGQYVNPGGAPRLEVNDRSRETLWHEKGHFLDHSLNNLQGDANVKNLASTQQGHPLNALVASLQATDTHKAFLDKTLQQEMSSPSPGYQQAFYRAHPTEVFARFFNELMGHEYAKKTGQPRTVDPTSEGYTPEELEEHGGRLRKVLAQHALRLGGRFERAGPMQVYTPGAEGVREADGGPAAPEAPASRPGPLARLKGALRPGIPAPTSPKSDVLPPSSPAAVPPVSQPTASSPPVASAAAVPSVSSTSLAPRLPPGVILPPSMQVDERGLRIETPYRTPDTPGSGVPRQTLHKAIPPERQPPRELTFPPPPADTARTTWLSPAEIAAGQTYVRGLHAAGQGGERTPHAGLLQAGLRRAWNRVYGADERPPLHAPSGHEFAEEFHSLMPGLGMYGPIGDEKAGGLPAYGVTDPAGWGAVQHSPRSLERYQNRPRPAAGQELAQADFTQPRPLPDQPAYQLSPEEFHAAPYTLHRGGTGVAPKEEGAMWLTPNRRLAEDYANQRLGQQPRHDRSQWDESLPGATVTSGLLDTTKFATEKEINAALERSGMTMGDLSHYMPRSDGGYAPYQALYMPDILDDLKGQGYGAFEGVGQQSGPFYVKYPGTRFLQHGDVVRRAHAQGLDVGQENRQRYSLGQHRTAPGGQTFWREGPPTMETPQGPVVPPGHYGVREATGHVPDGPPYPRPEEPGRRAAHEAHAHVERARAAYRDTWRSDHQGRRPAQLLAERRLAARAVAPSEGDEGVGPALAAEQDLAHALAARALARRLLGPAPGPLPWEEDHERAPGEGHRPVGHRPAQDAERALRRRAARAKQGELHPAEDWLRTKEELMHQRALHEALATRGWAPTPHERRELVLAQQAHHEAMNRRPTGAGPLVQEKPLAEDEAPDVRRARVLYRDPEQVPASPATMRQAMGQFGAELERRYGPGAQPQTFAEQLRLALLKAEATAGAGSVREVDGPLGPLARPQPAVSQPVVSPPVVEPAAPMPGPLAVPRGPSPYRQHFSRARDEIARMLAPRSEGQGMAERRRPHFVSMVPQETGVERRETEHLLGPGRGFDEFSQRSAAFNLGAAPGDAPRLVSALPQSSGEERRETENLLGPGHTLEEHAHRAAAFNVGPPASARLPTPASVSPSAAGPLARLPRVPKKEEPSGSGL